MANLWAAWRVRVNTLSPGPFATELLIAADRYQPGSLSLLAGLNPQNRIADLAEIICPALYLASDASSFGTGDHIAVCGGMRKYLEGLLKWVLKRYEYAGKDLYRSELSRRGAALENQNAVEQPDAVKQMQGVVLGDAQRRAIASALDALIVGREISLCRRSNFHGAKMGQRVRRADPTRLIAECASSLTRGNNANPSASPPEGRKVAYGIRARHPTVGQHCYVA